MERLVAGLADPNDAMGLLQMAMRPTFEQRIGRGLLPYVAPAGTGLFPVLAE